MANNAAGIMGTTFCQRYQWLGGVSSRTVYKDDIALPHALFSEYSRQSFHLVEQLAVCVFLYTPRDRRVPDYCNSCAIASLNMPIDAIICSRYLPVWEPIEARAGHTASECFRWTREGARGYLVPVQLIGLMFPEGFGITERPCVGVVLGMRCHGLFLIVRGPHFQCEAQVCSHASQTTFLHRQIAEAMPKLG